MIIAFLFLVSLNCTRYKSRSKIPSSSSPDDSTWCCVVEREVAGIGNGDEEV
jgi:hypothetical protein